jgi:hypothetical protein
MQMPPWMNGALGAFMLAAGVYFFIIQKGMDTRTRLVLLVGYIAVAGFYFYRAYRGYRERASSS